MSELSLSTGESLLVHRRRLGETQEHAAKRCHTTRYIYGQIERDVIVNGVALPCPAVMHLEPFEWCLLKRLRTGIIQAEVARRIGCSRHWLNKMERGLAPDGALVKYWKQER